MPRPDSFPSGLIDVHAHFVQPGRARQRNEAYRAEHYLSDPVTSWSPEQAIAFMDARAMDAQLLSHPRALSPQAAAESNDYGASIVQQYPQRFGLLANLPMATPSAAIEEIERSSVDLGADGFVIATNYDGTYLGDSTFDIVFEELDRRGATVLLHPVRPAGFELVSCGRPTPIIEFTFDTARTVVDAVYAGVFRRYPRFNLIVAHAGGPLPALTPRIATIGTHGWVPRDEAVTREDIRNQIGGLYYDTAIAGTACSMGPLMEVTTPDHIVFGTDYILAGEQVIDENIRELSRSDVLTYEEIVATRATALRLFPSLAGRLALAREQ